MARSWWEPVKAASCREWHSPQDARPTKVGGVGAEQAHAMEMNTVATRVRARLATTLATQIVQDDRPVGGIREAVEIEVIDARKA